MKEITQALCGIPFSKSTVSQLVSELDSQIKAFLDKPLEEEYPYLFIDAKYEKVRENHKIVSKGVLIVLGVSSSGSREILDVSIANGENETTYSDLFKRLQERGLRGVRLVISDDHAGFWTQKSRGQIFSRRILAEVSGPLSKKYAQPAASQREESLCLQTEGCFCGA